jgi:hypothetical protein
LVLLMRKRKSASVDGAVRPNTRLKNFITRIECKVSSKNNAMKQCPPAAAGVRLAQQIY